MKYYLFTDVETTGLNHHTNTRPRDNKMLEIAYILTDDRLNIKSVKEHLIKRNMKTIQEEMNDVVRKMHLDSGLINDLKIADSKVSVVEEEILNDLEKYIKKDDKVILAGSSVDFDREVIRQNMPTLFKRLHYRILDVSSVREFLKITRKFGKLAEEGENNKEYAHRALLDIQETLEELKKYISNVDVRL